MHHRNTFFICPMFEIFVIIKKTKPSVIVQDSLRENKVRIEIHEEKNHWRLNSYHINELNE